MQEQEIISRALNVMVMSVVCSSRVLTVDFVFR